MANKFYGTFEQLHELAADLDPHGTWEPEQNKVYMLRCDCGENLHWASTTKSLWFDGPEEAKRQLANRYAKLLPPG